MQKKFYLMIAIMILSLSFNKTQAQSILSTESFDATTFPPTGWSVTPLGTPQTGWSRRTASTFPTAAPHSGAGFARFNRNSSVGATVQLVSRAIDYTNRGTNPANLNFWMFRDSTVNSYDSITIWANNVDSITATAVKLGTIARFRSYAIPDTQAVDGWYNYSYSIPSSFAGTSTHFIFAGISHSPAANQGAHMYIDDISFDEFPPVCTGTPNAGSIVNSTSTICGGTGVASFSLSAPITGVAGITYIWNSSSSIAGPWTPFGSNAPTAISTILTSKTYFQCIVNCFNSGLSYTTPVDSVNVIIATPSTVSVTPANAVYCVGTSGGVSLTASGANTYTWSPAVGLNTTTGATVSANPATNTQYLVTGIDINGCHDTQTVNVIASNPPLVNITTGVGDTVCAGSTIVLNSTQGGGGNGNTYLWSDGNTTRRDTIIVGTSNISYSVLVTNAAGCSAMDTINLTVINPTIAKFGFTQTGNTFAFSDSSINGASWSWDFGDGNTSTQQNPVYTYSALGTYTVTLTVVGLTCGTAVYSYTIILAPESVHDIASLNGFSYYPNPTQDQLNVSLTSQKISSLSIKNQVGQNVVDIKQPLNPNLIVVPVNNLASGLYIVNLSTEGKVYQFKFVKQ